MSNAVGALTFCVSRRRLAGRHRHFHVEVSHQSQQGIRVNSEDLRCFEVAAAGLWQRLQNRGGPRSCTVLTFSEGGSSLRVVQG
jgi:hypothetical protein